MESYVLNKKQNYKFIIIEKTNQHSQEMTLWDILKVDYGFKKKIMQLPPSWLEKIKKNLGLSIKNRFYFLSDFLVAEINNNQYEIYFDTWSVEMTQNGVKIFDASRFENEELLQLIV